MANRPPVNRLQNHDDLFKKAQYDFSQYKNSGHVYDLSNCLLALNAVPEWIEKSENVSKELCEIAKAKIQIMMDCNFDFDEAKLEEDIDHQLRFVRMFCNHLKHRVLKNEKKQNVFKKIELSSGPFPLTFPIQFNHISIGENSYDSLKILSNIIEFWKIVLQL